MNKKGFTLIELLVVVLIIGILAAIALPQYFRAVERSRATEALSILGSLATAMERSRLVTGEYPTGANAFDELDIDLFDATGTQAAGFPLNTRNFTIEFDDDVSLTATRNDANNPYQIIKNIRSGRVSCDATGATTTCGSLGLPEGP